MITSKRVKIILSSLFLSLFLIFSGQIITEHSHVHAQQSSDPCETQGYKNWNGWWWNSDGVDCWCNERANVTSPCSSTTPVEN